MGEHAHECDFRTGVRTRIAAQPSRLPSQIAESRRLLRTCMTQLSLPVTESPPRDTSVCGNAACRHEKSSQAPGARRSGTHVASTMSVQRARRSDHVAARGASHGDAEGLDRSPRAKPSNFFTHQTHQPKKRNPYLPRSTCGAIGWETSNSRYPNDTSVSAHHGSVRKHALPRV